VFNRVAIEKRQKKIKLWRKYKTVGGDESFYEQALRKLA
jgi:hypothetical protein